MKNTPSQRRKKVVQQAIANEKLDGLQVSKESKTIDDTYMVGKASAKHAAAAIRARYGVGV
jgi:hypothetical protein